MAKSPEYSPPNNNNSIGMKFVLIPPGEFMMGSPNSDDMALNDEKPRHRVRISQPFYMGKYEVTQREWKAVMGEDNNPSYFRGNNLPVESVSWKKVQEFINKFNKREGREVCRLPSEAQWEYAARAGSEARYHFGDEVSKLEKYAWYNWNAGGKTHQVGQKPANAWQLHDMHGNVWEWVEDSKRPYKTIEVTDPQGPTDTGVARILRGGSWTSHERFARSAFRSWPYPGGQENNVGFRCSSPAVSQSSK